MKRLSLIIAVSGLMILSSCKDGVSFLGGGKEAKAKIAMLEQENADLKKQLQDCKDIQNAEIMSIRSDYEKKLADLQLKLEAGTASEYNGYYVVVGSFKNQKYAQDYSAKVKQMGYEGNIVAGPNNFNLVTYGSYKTLKSSLEPMRKARQSVSSEAWIYFK